MDKSITREPRFNAVVNYTFKTGETFENISRAELRNLVENWFRNEMAVAINVSAVGESQ